MVAVRGMRAGDRPHGYGLRPRLGRDARSPSSPRRGPARSSRATSARCTTAACSTSPRSQTEKGDWTGSGSEHGPGLDRPGLMAFLASGEDPNFGLYSNHVRRALRSIITAQDADHGHPGARACITTASPCSAWPRPTARSTSATSGPTGKGPRSIGQALELAVRAAITSQKKNPLGAWRYSPDATDADTSVSGAVLVGLLAARNAGIEVPDEAIDKAISYYKSMTSTSGQVAYAGGMGGFGDSLARSSIATLVYAVARRKDLPEFKATLGYLKEQLEQPAQGYRRIRPLLPGPGALPGRHRGLGEVEQAAGPPAEAGPAARRQLPGPVRPGVQHVDVAAGPGAQLPLPTHLRTIGRGPHA